MTPRHVFTILFALGMLASTSPVSATPDEPLRVLSPAPGDSINGWMLVDVRMESPGLDETVYDVEVFIDGKRAMTSFFSSNTFGDNRRATFMMDVRELPPGAHDFQAVARGSVGSLVSDSRTSAVIPFTINSPDAPAVFIESTGFDGTEFTGVVELRMLASSGNGTLEIVSEIGGFSLEVFARPSTIFWEFTPTTTAPGDYPAMIVATDGAGRTTTVPLTLRIAPDDLSDVTRRGLTLSSIEVPADGTLVVKTCAARAPCSEFEPVAGVLAVTINDSQPVCETDIFAGTQSCIVPAFAGDMVDVSAWLQLETRIVVTLYES